MKRVVCKEEEKRKRKGEIGMGRGWRAKKRKGVRVSDTSLVSEGCFQVMLFWRRMVRE